MRFLRHLGATLLVVSAVVGLGFLWRSSPAAGLVSGGDRHELARGTASDAPPPLGGFPERRDLKKTGAFNVEGIPDFVQSVITVVLVGGGIVLIDRRRRNQHRAQRLPLRVQRSQ